MTALLLDVFVLVMALVSIVGTLPEWFLTVGDIRYQRRHGIR